MSPLEGLAGTRIVRVRQLRRRDGMMSPVQGPRRHLRRLRPAARGDPGHARRGPVRFATAVMAHAGQRRATCRARASTPQIWPGVRQRPRAGRRRGRRRGAGAAPSRRARRRCSPRDDARPSIGSRAGEPAARTIDAGPRPRCLRPTSPSCRFPGPYAALEAHKALGRGLHVLLFSDNVPVEEEIELKHRAMARGPAADGTGRGDGRARRLRTRVRQRGVAAAGSGVVAAAGTGAQEVMSLLDQWGVGVSQVDRRRRPGPVGPGRRAHGPAPRCGRSTPTPATDVVLLVTKPPADGRRPGGDRRGRSRRRWSAALIGLQAPIEVDPTSIAW